MPASRTFYSRCIGSAQTDFTTRETAQANKETRAWVREQELAGYHLSKQSLTNAHNPFDPKAKRIKVVMRKL